MNNKLAISPILSRKRLAIFSGRIAIHSVTTRNRVDILGKHDRCRDLSRRSSTGPAVARHCDAHDAAELFLRSTTRNLSVIAEPATLLARSSGHSLHCWKMHPASRALGRGPSEVGASGGSSAVIPSCRRRTRVARSPDPRPKMGPSHLSSIMTSFYFAESPPSLAFQTSRCTGLSFQAHFPLCSIRANTRLSRLRTTKSQVMR